MNAGDAMQSEVFVLMEQLRREYARQRPIYPSQGEAPMLSFSRIPESSSAFEEKSSYELSDFLLFHDEEFVRNAYRGILRRAPDPDGFARFLSRLRYGALSKVELLGRLRFSAEGRVVRVRVKGLLTPFVVRTARRVPILGHVLAILQYIARLPHLARNIERLESELMRAHFETARSVNSAYGQLERYLGSIDGRLAELSYAVEASLVRLGDETIERTSRLREFESRVARHFADLDTRVGQDAKRFENELKEVSGRLELMASRHQVEALRASVDQTQQSVVSVGRDLELLTNHVRVRGETLDRLHAHIFPRDSSSVGEQVAELDKKLALFRRVVLEQERQIARVCEAVGNAVGPDALEAMMAAVANVGNRLLDSFSGIDRSPERAGADVADLIEPEAEALIAETRSLEGRLTNRIASLERDLSRMTRVAGDAKLTLDAFSPPPLAETLEVIGGPLVEPARHRARVRTDVPVSGLSAHERYAVFEAAFYDSALVADKQRVYRRYFDRIPAREHPFVDLGCGRGEFLAILAGVGLPVVGVDVNPSAFADLRAAGFEVVEQDLLRFLQSEHRMFSGASVLQVVEHLTSVQIDRMLKLLAQRLVPGALLIIETPNPLCPFALGQFHTDPTHIAPLPPERLRFAIEAAGFTGSRTLFQARAPGPQLAGPDSRAYYMDYAIIAYRSAT